MERAWIRETDTPNWGAKDRRQDQGGGRGVRGLIYLINGLKEMRPIQNEGFEILACISDNYLRLTTAHTQILQHYPHLPLKVVMGSIIIFSLAINIG